MANVVIKCPKTGKLVPTGMNMDEASFKSSSMTNNSFNCPACGETHTWNKDQASLQKSD
jgi:endogenous inhibitor of DNA gyrase (YacG/DUF329 family)